jgi:hypothetical protein
MVTAVGCLMRGDQIRGGDEDNYALASPTQGPVDNVPEGTCTAESGAPALDLKDGPENGLSDAMLGHWVEVSGELEKETSSDPDNLRELDVRSARLVPVLRPQAAPAPRPARRPVPPPAAAPEPAPAAPEPVPAPAPVMPTTASEMPAIALIGLLSLAGAVALRSLRLRGPY